MACVFCDDRDSAGETIIDFGEWSLLLHPDSAVRGHAMLVLRRHVENFSDLSDSEAQQFVRVAKVCERALLEATATGRAVLLKLGIATPHLHIHIYPVPRTATRDEVQRVIDARVSEPRASGFAALVRERILRLT